MNIVTVEWETADGGYWVTETTDSDLIGTSYSLTEDELLEIRADPDYEVVE